MKTCPFCKEEIPDDASVCPVCNEKLNATKACPYCNEEIPANLRVCPACGEVLKQQVNIRVNKKVLITLCSTLLVLFVLIGVSIGILSYEAKSVNAINHEVFILLDAKVKALLDVNKEGIKSFDNLYDVLTEFSQKEAMIKKYLAQPHLQINKDRAFIIYYKAIEAVCEGFNDINYSSDYRYSISSFNSTLNSGYADAFGYELEKSIRIVPIMYKPSEYNGSYNHIKALKITKPQVPFIKMSYAGEGYFEAEINYKYLCDEYSKYLSSDIKEYLSLKQKEEQELDNHIYYKDGAIGVTRTVLTDWIISWQNFRDKYPKFRIENINEMLNFYTADFINSLYTTFDYDNSLLPTAKKDITFGYDNSLLPTAKKDYETFLQKVNPKTPEYKAVEKCYSILKEHGFKYTNEFTVCYEEWINKNEE